MVFSSLEFLFIYMPAFFAVYFLAKDRYKNIWLLVGSLIFYGYGTIRQPAAFALLILSVVVNYAAGRGMEKHKKHRKLIFILGLIYDFGCLFIFKYLNFILGTLCGLVQLVRPLSHPQIQVSGLALPIGISFYTFQIVSYLADIYMKRIPAEKSPIKLGTYLCMFPKLIDGPITPYRTIADQLGSREHSLRDVNMGLMDFTIGLGLKVLLANRIGGLWSDIGTIGFESISTPLAWMGAAAYSMQIYFDFWGYSLMAVGLGRMLGFEILQNFDNPYSALTMTDFWRKWHITLGAWFREYVYIPLGGNRKGKARMVRNMLVVWLFTGLWHGASWNFVLWGLLTFLLIAVEKFWTGDFLNAKPALGHLYMTIVIPLMWTVFAISDFGALQTYFERLFPFWNSGVNVLSYDYLKYGRIYGVLMLIGLVFCTPYPMKFYRKIKGSAICTVLLLAVFWASVYCLYIGLNDPFMYFQF